MRADADAAEIIANWCARVTDGKPVIIDIGYIVGGDEGHAMAEMLLNMFVAWADRQGLAHDVLERTPATGGGLVSARLGITTSEQAHLEALHQGVHTLIRIPPGRERRQMGCAGVRVSQIAIDPLPDSTAGWGDERRRYIFDPERAIADALLGRLDLDPAVVLAGDFSRLEQA